MVISTIQKRKSNCLIKKIILPDNISENISKYIDGKKVEVSSIISINDAKEVSCFIENENKKKPHMLQKSQEEIFTSAKDNGGIKLLLEDKIIGFMCLYKFSHLYELGSLCIWEEYRDKGLATFIQKQLIDTFISLPIFLVTNVDKVKHISEKSGMYNIPIPELSKKLVSTIEEGGKLLPDDIVYINKVLYANEQFILLNEDKNK